MGNTTSASSEVDEFGEVTVDAVEILVAHFPPIMSRQKEKVKRKVKIDKDVVDEKEQALIESLQVIMQLVDSEVEASRNRLTELLGAEQDDGEFNERVKVVYKTIKQSLDAITQQVDFIVSRLSDVIRNDYQMKISELHQKIHNGMFLPVLKIFECLGALRRVNEECGCNNTSTKECEAIVKDWTRCNIPFGLVEITFHFCSLQSEWPNQTWRLSFQDLLITVDRLKNVDWFYELVTSVASGDKERVRDFDDQLRDYQNKLREVLPTFEHLLQALSGYSPNNGNF